MPVLEFAAVIEIMAFAERLAGGMIDEYELVAQTMGCLLYTSDAADEL